MLNECFLEEEPPRKQEKTEEEKTSEQKTNGQKGEKMEVDLDDDQKQVQLTFKMMTVCSWW